MTTPETVRYTGRVSSVPDDNYGFIAIRTVKCTDGQDHKPLTRFDIFIHKDDCDGFTLEEGLLVEFECGPDARRGEGYLRAIDVKTADETAIMPRSGPFMPGFVVERSAIPYHAAMKKVLAEEVELAHANRPLEGLPRDEEVVSVPDDQDGLMRFLSTYLEQQFPQLAGVDISYEIADYDKDAQDAKILAEAAGLGDLGMAEQVQELREAYARFQAVRKLLVLIVERGLLRPGTQLSPSILKAVVNLVEQANNSEQKLQAVLSVEQTIGFMIDHGLLRPNTVILIRNIVELFCACPVWFWMLSENETHRAVNARQEEDPHPHEVTIHICKMVPNPRWCHAFQMFNRRTRGLDIYRGEIIPTRIRELLKSAAEAFDAVVIMTPYHDVAGLDWGDLEWLRSLDPYVIGFKWGLPVFFVLGRFSDSGIFPLVDELVADTVQFLRANEHRLEGFNKAASPWWYVSPTQDYVQGHELGSFLRQHADQMIQAFEAGHLFDWLRGEWNLPSNEPAPASNDNVDDE